MFRVEFFVDDKRLGAALLALVGIAHGQPGVTPVVNAKTNGHAVVAVSAGSSLERFAELLKPHKGETIIARDVAAMMKKLGMSLSSRSYVLKRAVEAKLLKKTGIGSGTKYQVQ
jgi:hypothetical protein